VDSVDANARFLHHTPSHLCCLLAASLALKNEVKDGLFPLFGGCHQLLTHTAELAIGHFHTLNDK
jgi:hypothetical protein